MQDWLSKLFRLFGSRNEREIKKLWPYVRLINSKEPEFETKTDAELREHTDRLKAQIKDGAKLDDMLVDAFALVREMSKRTPPPGSLKGLRHFDVQLIGGVVLHQGKIAEMVTGEGKTLVATCPAFLNALGGGGVHVVTVNDYLARRDREWMGPIYERLGLSVGVIEADMSNEQRRIAYAADITYGTNNEFGFDYLRDNMKGSLDQQVQRRNFGILDEVDNILIDEARTPLIISGAAEGDVKKYYAADRVARQLKKDAHFEVKEKENQAILSEDGIIYAQKIVGVDSFYTGTNMEWPHLLEQALRAHHLYTKDAEYVVMPGEDGHPEVVIVDEFTGRLMHGRRWSDGLHQAVEAKEQIVIRAENQTLATITFQNFFKLYKKLAGMTGTALTEAGEFLKIYNLDVMVIPTHRPLVRKDQDDKIYASQKEKFTAVVDDILETHGIGRPILVGTTSIEKSEKLSEVLSRRGIVHQVLNAKQHAREAAIVAQAGRKGSVTIATNMAGRGTDILLGGNPEFLAKEQLVREGFDPHVVPPEEIKKLTERVRIELTEPEKRFVVSQGGLHILGTERHEARRIDNQLRGRAGRQGDPGTSRFYLSLDDDLMRRFASPTIKNMLVKLGLKDGEAIEHRWVTRSVERAQKKVEERNFDIRKRLLEYDDVMNEQRTLIYDYRQQVLRGEGLREMVERMYGEVIDLLVPDEDKKGDAGLTDEQVKTLAEFARRKLGVESPDLPRHAAEAKAKLKEILAERYAAREAEVGADSLRVIERFLLLDAFDTKWKDHLYNMDALKSGIGLRGYASEDPKTSYKREGYQLFEEMLRTIQEQVTDYVLRIEIRPQERLPQKDVWAGGQAVKESFTEGVGGGSQQMQEASEKSQSQERPKPFRRDQPKVGRNEDCPCGSGRKYKKCHGRRESA